MGSNVEPLVFEKQEVRHFLIMRMPLYRSNESNTLPDADILSKSGSHGLSREKTSTTAARFQVVVSDILVTDLTVQIRWFKY